MLILVGFTVIGARRGLLQTLTGLVIVVVALVGAGMIATTFSGPAAKLAAPLIEKQIEKKIEVMRSFYYCDEDLVASIGKNKLGAE